MKHIAGGAYGRRLSLPELALVATLTPLVGASWLALISAQLGVFSAGWVLGAGAALLGAVVFCLLAASRRQATDLHEAAPGRKSRLAARPTLVDLVALLVVASTLLRMWPAATPWPAFLDASWYVNAGARIAIEGSLVARPEAMPDDEAARRALVSTLADGRAEGFSYPQDESRGFFDVAFAVPDVARPEVAPYHPPLFASWLAAWSKVTGLGAAGSAVIPWTAVYLLALLAFTSAAAGAEAAGLAVALLAAGPALGYYGATPYAETAAGALVLSGLWLLVRVAEGPRRPALVAAAGLLLGLSCLMKIDAVPALVAGAVWWVATRRRTGSMGEGIAFVAGSAIPLAHGLWLATGVTDLYYTLNIWGLVRLARETLGRLAQPAPAFVLLACAVALGIVLWARVLRLEAFPSGTAIRTGLAGLMVLFAALATVAALVRSGSEIGGWQLLEWVVTPLGLWAGVGGLVLVSRDYTPRHGPLFVAAIVAIPAAVAAPAVTTSISPLYTVRRLVPVALPLVAALAGVAGAWTAARIGRGQRADETDRPAKVGSGPPKAGLLRVVAAGLALLALAGVSQAAAPWRSGQAFAGGETLAERLAAYGSARDVMLFPSTLNDEEAGRMAAPVWNLTGRPSAVLARPYAEAPQLASLFAEWSAEGRSVYFVSGGSDPPEVPGYAFYEVGREGLVTYVPAPVQELPPTWAAKELSLAVYEYSPVDEG